MSINFVMDTDLKSLQGIGYDADESVASTDPTQIYPNIIAQLKNQGSINTLAYSLWLNDLSKSLHRDYGWTAAEFL